MANDRHDDADAFIREDGSRPGGAGESRDDLAAMLAEDFLENATSGESTDNDVHDEVLVEEMGGPFVVTAASTEFGSTVEQDDDDESAEQDGTEKENFPIATAPLVVKPRRK